MRESRDDRTDPSRVPVGRILLLAVERTEVPADDDAARTLTSLSLLVPALTSDPMSEWCRVVVDTPSAVRRRSTTVDGVDVKVALLMDL